MTREEAIAIIENEKECVNRANKNDYCNRDCYNCELVKTDIEILTALDMAIKALEQEPCDVPDINDGNISETQESENTCDGCYNFESEHMSRVIKNLYDSLESEEISREEIAALLARGSEELCGDPCKELPSAQPEPSEITEEQAIRHLQSTGWMQNHDREMYESGLREKLADDSGSYDSLTLCEDAISRESLKSKLKEHHDFFVNAYGGFSNLPLNDKSRVDEITACIAMVVNEPPVTPKQRTGWIPVSDRLPDKYTYTLWCASSEYVRSDYFNGEFWEDAKKYCYEIVAWMPLPEPYQAESEDKE